MVLEAGFSELIPDWFPLSTGPKPTNRGDAKLLLRASDRYQILQGGFKRLDLLGENLRN